MKKLNKKATAIFRRLTDGLTGDHHKHDNTPGFMAVSIEIIAKSPMGQIVAVAHYYEQCGDLMADPDMTFMVTEDGVFPMTFQQDNLGLYQKAAWWDHDQLKFRPKLQADLVKFANQWMTNIGEQQF